jgi:hypothetical protein
LREVNLVRMGNADFASINREQLAGFLLRHRNKLSLQAALNGGNPAIFPCSKRANGLCRGST